MVGTIEQAVRRKPPRESKLMASCPSLTRQSRKLGSIAGPAA
jgi:hypothetical protein